MKRLFLGLIAIVIAVGASAFTSASDKQAKNVAAIVYYQDENTGLYTKAIPGGTCTDSVNPCRIEFPNPNNLAGPASFTLGVDEPTNLGEGEPSLENGYYH